ncbi:hypothetical protein RDV64_03845 [Acuticoccus sp. MNP-M23]|uniref:hypothetical protein n=1 Tax=Acuticoccus sp. MNP-M23 TaxID=3072793 RepID=UPI002815BE72|nr:hypothetical protein [Acuticoccus sp. MNP-M23]WMS43543.1 hypothetical protein RDV64_03845 [Acuticoccus sp. MNP-M23]
MPQSRTSGASPLVGLLIVLVTLLVVISDWGGSAFVGMVTPVATVALALVLAFKVRAARLAFILAAAGLTVAVAILHDDWQDDVLRGLGVTAFIVAFFSALATLRNAAQTSPAIRTCGAFLASQPPGRRYAALSVGGQLFSLLLNYGAIALLGSLAATSAREEPDLEIRTIRLRRMLLAIQRAMVSTLPWSPLSFSIAISTALIPGTAWASVVVPSLVSGLILVGTGYAMDTLFKPRLNRPRPQPRKVEGGWSSLYPLLMLLAILFGLVGVLHVATGVRTVGVVTLVVPLVSLLWIGAQAEPGNRVRHMVSRSREYVRSELPSYRGEITLLSMAGYIGTLGGVLLAPWIAEAGISFETIPTAAILVGLIWIFPIAGQFAMNPLLAASLLLPLLPTPAAMGISPTALQVAVTAGWALTGACSPFTATTIITGSFADKSAWHVGLRWNGLYTVLCALVLSGWVLVYAYVL